MTLEARTKERFRLRLKRWFEERRRVVGCATVALKSVARDLGKSPAWVRRIMNEHRSPATIQAHHYVALLLKTMKAPKFSQQCKTIPVTLDLRERQGVLR